MIIFIKSNINKINSNKTNKTILLLPFIFIFIYTHYLIIPINININNNNIIIFNDLFIIYFILF